MKNISFIAVIALSLSVLTACGSAKGADIVEATEVQESSVEASTIASTSTEPSAESEFSGEAEKTAAEETEMASASDASMESTVAAEDTTAAKGSEPVDMTAMVNAYQAYIDKTWNMSFDGIQMGIYLDDINDDGIPECIVGQDQYSAIYITRYLNGNVYQVACDGCCLDDYRNGIICFSILDSYSEYNSIYYKLADDESSDGTGGNLPGYVCIASDTNPVETGAAEDTYTIYGEEVSSIEYRSFENEVKSYKSDMKDEYYDSVQEAYEAWRNEQ